MVSIQARNIFTLGCSSYFFVKDAVICILISSTIIIMRVLGIGHLRNCYCLGAGIGFLITGYITTSITSFHIQWRSRQDIDKFTQQETQVVSCIGRRHVCARRFDGTSVLAIGLWRSSFNLFVFRIPALLCYLALWKEHPFVLDRVYRQS